MNPDQEAVMSEGLDDLAGMLADLRGRLEKSEQAVCFLRSLLGSQERGRALLVEKATNARLNELLDFIAARYEIDRPLILSSLREQAIFTARSLTMLFGRELFQVTTSALGCFFNRDRCAVSHALRAMQNRINTETPFRLEVETLRADLRAHFKMPPLKKEAA